jgi:hypothetical protein
MLKWMDWDPTPPLLRPYRTGLWCAVCASLALSVGFVLGRETAPDEGLVTEAKLTARQPRVLPKPPGVDSVVPQPMIAD